MTSSAISRTAGQQQSLLSLPSWPCRFDPGRPLHRFQAFLQVRAGFGSLERPTQLTAGPPDLPVFAERCGPDVAQRFAPQTVIPITVWNLAHRAISMTPTVQILCVALGHGRSRSLDSQVMRCFIARVIVGRCIAGKERAAAIHG
jgi:hypothetical protein